MQSLMRSYETIKYRKFRILFEDTKARGFIGWTVISECKTKQDALNRFTKHFSAKEVISVSEIVD
jgi:hypothetical protein